MSDAARLSSILGYLGDLIAYPTAYPPGHSTEIATYLEQKLAGLGYETEVVTKDEHYVRRGFGWFGSATPE